MSSAVFNQRGLDTFRRARKAGKVKAIQAPKLNALSAIKAEIEVNNPNLSERQVSNIAQATLRIRRSLKQ